MSQIEALGLYWEDANFSLTILGYCFGGGVENDHIQELHWRNNWITFLTEIE